MIRGRTKQIENILEKKLTSSTTMDLSAIQVEVQEKIKSMIQTVDRGTKIIKGLKSFARDGSVHTMEAASAKEVIDDTLLICNEKLKNHGFDLEVKTTDLNLFISCDSQQTSRFS
jgi:C4-dicarboxylate-specific signal transduction histidine kinase